ncbi:MAG: ABC transporter ATP-binding protein [Fusicatenibacter sp.]|nr:ABC transporter ATP-binding protein [Fusicatenibacter sp.]
MTPMKWFCSFLKKYRKRMIAGLILTTAMASLAIIAPQVSGRIVDQVIQGGNYGMLPGLLGLLLTATVLRAVLRFCVPYNFEICSQGVLYDMRDTVYRKLLKEDFDFYNKNRTGDLMSRQTGDMDAIRAFVAQTIYAVYECVLYFVFALIMVFTVNEKLAFSMVCILPFTAVTTYFQMKAVKPAFHRIRKQFSSLNTYVQENISGNRVIKAFAKEDYEIERFEKENDAFRDAQLASADIWTKYVPVFEFFSNILTVVLMLYGGYLAIHQEMTVGEMVTVNGYLWMLNMPLRMAGWYINDIQRFVTSVEKIYSTFSVEPKIKMPVSPENEKKIRGEVEFRHVSYQADDEKILEDINFHVLPGQTIGILGSTGAGKSTIMNLLCRFYDATQGEVLIDGVNVKDRNLYELRDHIGMAMQDVFLFSDTIEGNIAYGRPECPFDEVHRAAVAADANHFIKEMPEGYDTIVGERGVGLSGGQKQRISLARALVKDPAILILDDTTSAVDMETESYIQEQLKKLGKNHTVFIIAYRISSIMNADQILVMDHGRIIERGTHKELVKNGGYYASVFEHQYKSEGKEDGTKQI